LRSLLVPLAIAIPPLTWVADATRRASLVPLGRDQGIFQYVAWALSHGAVDYRDVRDVNGPLTHLVHMVFLALGGADEHRFRVLDLLVTGASFALVGACVAGVGLRAHGGVASGAVPRGPDMLERAAWAIAGWVVLSGQYLLYLYWDLAQRESFFDWFMLTSVALQLVAQAQWRGHGQGHDRAKRQARLLFVVGALSLAPWLGKPTYALFTIAQLLALLVDDGLVLSRRRAALAFGLGGALGVAVPLAFVVAYGDLGAYLRIQLHDVPTMYRFIWPRAAMDIFSGQWHATQAIFGAVGAVVILGLVVSGQMPRRVVAVALLPLCGVGSVVVQQKGFPYHFHPVTAGIALQWLVFASWLTDRTRVARRALALVRLAPLAIGVVIALRVATSMEDSPHIRMIWLLWGAETPEDRSTREYFAHFPEPDFFPFEMRQTAAYLKEHTKPGDRVQTYGMDAYVLFLAERRSATPYIYAYDLDADAALYGGTGGRPDEAQAARIRALRDQHEDDLLARLQAQPPAAFVFLDTSPLVTKDDAWEDFRLHCGRAAAWVEQHYEEAARFGHDHVWLRSNPSDDTP
jgi:hypothetical protein